MMMNIFLESHMEVCLKDGNALFINPVYCLKAIVWLVLKGIPEI